MNKLTKIKEMKTEEILYRIKEKVLQTKEFCDYKIGSGVLSDKKFLKGGFLDLQAISSPIDIKARLSTGPRDLFFSEVGDQQAKRRLAQEYLNTENWIRQANQILAGKITLLGKEIQIDSDNWHRDSFNDINWPKRFYALIKEPQKHSDIKYIWEINRHQYLILLAKAFWLTGNEKYSEDLFDKIESWINDNPFNVGVNWSSALECAVRSISWIWCLMLCKDSVHFTIERAHRITKTIYLHGLYISRHLSFYTSPYNHLVGEAAALHLIGGLFPFLRHSQKWEESGWQILCDQIERQFYEDGACVEQALFYHHFTLGFYLQSVIFRQINNKNIPKHVLKRLESALNFSVYLTKPDATVPMIGDIDNARSLYFDFRHSWNFTGIQNLGALLFNKEDFKSSKENLPEEIFWFSSEEKIRKFLSLNVKNPNHLGQLFPFSGYVISRSDWGPTGHYLYFDCGEMAAGLFNNEIPSAAHGHADSLGIELSAFGENYLVDGGFNTYFGDIEWHKHFRQEEAHNTVFVERQAKFTDRLTWSNVVNPELDGWISRDHYDFISGSIVFDSGVRQNRKILYTRDRFWVINDVISIPQNKKYLNAETHFNFDPQVQIEVDQEKRILWAFQRNSCLMMKWFYPVSLIQNQGGTKPSQGWISEGYGLKSASWHLAFIWQTSKQVQSFPFLVIPFEKKEGVQENFIEGSINNTDSEMTYDFIFGKEKDQIELKLNGAELEMRSTTGHWKINV